MGSERFVLELQCERPEFGEDYDGLCVVDTLTDAVVGCDGGEPEDQTLGRDWRWVVAALNAVNAERDAAIAERDRLRREVEALRGALRERASLFDGDARRSGAELAYEARTVADRIAAILAGPEKEPTDAA